MHVPADAWDDTMRELEARGVSFLFAPGAREDFGKTVRAGLHPAIPRATSIELTDVDPT